MSLIQRRLWELPFRGGSAARDRALQSFSHTAIGEVPRRRAAAEALWRAGAVRLVDDTFGRAHS